MATNHNIVDVHLINSIFYDSRRGQERIGIFFVVRDQVGYVSYYEQFAGKSLGHQMRNDT